ncbi:MAG: hypothetical protein Q7J16_11170 [Candidatus Cloacimonadales bacterium]|nr:hypothetical protein [Candidatus Cloacimonadales bacterium]
MKKLILIIFLGAVMMLSANEFLIPELESLRSYLNTTWKGEFGVSEKVEGDANGITEVKNVTEILEDGRLLSKAYFFKKW